MVYATDTSSSHLLSVFCCLRYSLCSLGGSLSDVLVDVPCAILDGVSDAPVFSLITLLDFGQKPSIHCVEFHCPNIWSIYLLL